MEKNNNKFDSLSENWNIKVCMLLNTILPTKRLRKNDNIFNPYSIYLALSSLSKNGYLWLLLIESILSLMFSFWLSVLNSVCTF